MNKLSLCTLFIFLLSNFPLCAATTDIEELMQREDYIQASLLVTSPGTQIYSAAGHLALRMRCELQNVDYVYEFKAVVEPGGSLIMNYLNGDLKGTYLREYYNSFISDVQAENRQIYEQKLQLTPDQEVALWSEMDELVDANREFPFLPSRNHCCSMILEPLQNSIEKNLFNRQYGIPVKEKGRDTLEEIFDRSQWRGFLWNILLGNDFDRYHQPIQLIYPRVLFQFLSQVKNPATGENLISSYKLEDLYREDSNVKITPSIAGLFILFLSLIISLLQYIFKWKVINMIGIGFDIFILTTITIFGVILWYQLMMSFYKDGISFNPLLIIFSPFPAILLLMRKKVAFIRLIEIVTLFSIFCLIFIGIAPALQMFGLWIFILSFIIRGVNLSIKFHTKTGNKINNTIKNTSIAYEKTN